MAVKSNFTFWHFLARLAGLTGVLAALGGLSLWFSMGETQTGQIVVGCGAAVAALALLFEVKGLFALASSRRGAVGFNVFVQVLLAAALLVGANYISFEHYKRFDWTRDALFTIKPEIREQLAKLRGVTDIIVYQPHRSFGQTADNKPDHYAAAAERKIVEKVKDLVEQFQEEGPRFRVQVLDIQDVDFEEKLENIRKQNTALAEAIEKTPENSILFHGQDKIQRLAFHDIYQLDRTASKKANADMGNLVLNYQGLEPFARKVLNIEEKQPRVAVAVVHPLLGLNDEEIDIYTYSGARKGLESQAFATQDIILKKGFETRKVEHAVFTFDENQFEFLDDQRHFLEKSVKLDRERLQTARPILEKLKTSSLEQLNQEFIHARKFTQPRLEFMTRAEFLKLKAAGLADESDKELAHVDELDRQRELRTFEDKVSISQIRLDRQEPELDRVRRELKELKVEDLEEKRRIADLRVKMNRVLADSDLLILPRVTLVNIPRHDDRINIPNEAHRLHDLQFAALRDFLKLGKPVLCCLGPTNERPEEAGPDTVDPVEQALEELGFNLPRQTILFNSEVLSFAQRRGNFLVAGNSKVEIPSAAFEWKPEALASRSSRPLAERSPLRTSLQFASRALAGRKDLELKVRHPRPVYLTRWDPAHAASIVAVLAGPGNGWTAPELCRRYNASRLVEEAVVMVSDPAGWNENQPFPSAKGPPQFEPNKPNDGDLATLLEKRQGAIPVAAATEVEIPSSWFPERTQEGWLASVLALAAAPDAGPLGASSALIPRKEGKVQTRLAVVGSGNVFAGKNLTPIQQKLLFDLSNWLLGRDDLLAQNRESWQFPRVQFSDTSYLLWQWLTRLGLPLAFIYLGFTMLLIRRMR